MKLNLEAKLRISWPAYRMGWHRSPQHDFSTVISIWRCSAAPLILHSDTVSMSVSVHSGGTIPAVVFGVHQPGTWSVNTQDLHTEYPPITIIILELYGQCLIQEESNWYVHVLHLRFLFWLLPNLAIMSIFCSCVEFIVLVSSYTFLVLGEFASLMLEVSDNICLRHDRVPSSDVYGHLFETRYHSKF